MTVPAPTNTEVSFPGEVVIDGHAFSLQVIAPGHKALGTQPNIGGTHLLRNEIVLDNTLPSTQLIETLFHEIAHVWFRRRCSGVEQRLKHKHLEALCDAVGAGLHQLISENPDLLSSLRAFYQKTPV